MYSIKIFIFNLISKISWLSYILHKSWILITDLRFYIILLKYKYLGQKILSLSDRGQDRWIIKIFELYKSNYNGFFLEIGGGDGFKNSNTFVLEKYHNWKGILVEPDPLQFRKLKKNRKKSISLNELVYDKNTTLPFSINGELSKINFTREKNKKTIKLRTIKLEQLLYKCKAPRVIDYFSLDSEGSEPNILTKSVINKYIFLSITIERITLAHHKLLISNDYTFVKSKIYDSFYVHKKFKNFDKIKKEKFFEFNKK